MNYDDKADNSQLNINVDLDIELVIGNIVAENRHCIVEQGFGYVNVQTRKTGCKINRTTPKYHTNEKVDKDGFITPYKAKNWFYRIDLSRNLLHNQIMTSSLKLKLEYEYHSFFTK